MCSATAVGCWRGPRDPGLGLGISKSSLFSLTPSLASRVPLLRTATKCPLFQRKDARHSPRHCGENLISFQLNSHRKLYPQEGGRQAILEQMSAPPQDTSFPNRRSRGSGPCSWGRQGWQEQHRTFGLHLSQLRGTPTRRTEERHLPRLRGHPQGVTKVSRNKSGTRRGPKHQPQRHAGQPSSKHMQSRFKCLLKYGIISRPQASLHSV